MQLTMDKLDFLMAQCFQSARKHTDSVSIRPHIKADRFERIGHWITDLKREISALAYSDLTGNSVKEFVKNLCHRQYWHDVGILESRNIRFAIDTGPVPFGDNLRRMNSIMVNNEDIERWIFMSMMGDEDEDILDQLAIDLERLDQSMTTVRSHITTAKSLNSSGAEVLQNLVSILEE